MARKNIEEFTDDEVRVRDTGRFFRPAYDEMPIQPPSNNRFMVFAGIVVNKELTEDQLNDLEQSMTNLPGVASARIGIGPSRIPKDRTPQSADLYMFMQAGFKMKVT